MKINPLEATKIDPIVLEAVKAAQAAFLTVANDPNVSPRDKWAKREAYMNIVRAAYRR